MSGVGVGRENDQNRIEWASPTSVVLLQSEWLQVVETATEVEVFRVEVGDIRLVPIEQCHALELVARIDAGKCSRNLGRRMTVVVSQSSIHQQEPPTLSDICRQSSYTASGTQIRIRTVDTNQIHFNGISKHKQNIVNLQLHLFVAIGTSDWPRASRHQGLSGDVIRVEGYHPAVSSETCSDHARMLWIGRMARAEQ